MKSPEHVLQSLIRRLPKPIRAVASSFATCFLWILFLESAASLISGKPFVRSAVLGLAETVGPSIGDLILAAWEVTLRTVDYWNLAVKEPIRQIASQFGIAISGEVFDILAVIVFGFMARSRARRERFEFERAVLRAAKPARMQQKPSLAFNPNSYRKLIGRRRPEDVSAELYEIQRNLDKILLTVVDKTRNMAPYNRYANAIVNMGTAETNALKVSDKTFEENWAVLMKGGRLQSEFRAALLNEIDHLIPWLFTDQEGWNLLVETIFAMTGTETESYAKWWGRQKSRLIYLIAAVVAVVSVLDVFLS